MVTQLTIGFSAKCEQYQGEHQQARKHNHKGNAPGLPRAEQPTPPHPARARLHVRYQPVLCKGAYQKGRYG